MLPLLAAAAGTAAAQYYNNEQNRRANKDLMDRNEDLINGIATPELSASDYDAVSQGIDPSQLYYDKYQYGGDYNPAAAGYDQEVGPTTVQESANAKFGRDAQVEALKKFQANIKAGYDPEFDAKMDQANTSSQANAQSRSQSILQDAQRRGQFGSNAMLAAQLQRSGDAMSEGARASQMAAVESYKNKLQQERDAATMGRNLASDENSLAAQNAEIVNSFNQRSSRAHQQYLNQLAEAQNQAQLRNLNSRQNINNSNVDIGNRQRTDQYNAAQKERDYQNRLVGQRQGVKQSNFDNQMSKAKGVMGVNHDRAQMNTGNAQANASMIQGVGQGFAGYMSAQDAADQRGLDRASNEKIARMKYGGGGGNNLTGESYDDYENMG